MSGAEDEEAMDARVQGAGQAVNVRLIGYDKPIFVAIAIALAVLAIVLAVVAEREARLAEYYAVDLKIYIVQQGLHPPQDPWHKP